MAIGVVSTKVFVTLRFFLTGDVANRRADDAKVALLKPARGLLTKDKVSGTLNQALRVQLIALVAEKSVLVSSQGASVVSAVSVGAQGDSLAALAVRIGNIDIVQLKVGRLDAKSGALVVVETISLALLGGDGDLVSAVAAGVGSVSVDGQLS